MHVAEAGGRLTTFNIVADVSLYGSDFALHGSDPAFVNSASQQLLTRRKRKRLDEQVRLPVFACLTYFSSNWLLLFRRFILKVGALFMLYGALPDVSTTDVDALAVFRQQWYAEIQDRPSSKNAMPGGGPDDIYPQSHKRARIETDPQQVHCLERGLKIGTITATKYTMHLPWLLSCRLCTIFSPPNLKIPPFRCCCALHMGQILSGLLSTYLAGLVLRLGGFATRILCETPVLLFVLSSSVQSMTC
jgi:hypothetical protein